MNSYQERSNAYQLELRPTDLLLFQIAVNNINSHIKRFGDHLELEVDLDLRSRKN